MKGDIKKHRQDETLSLASEWVAGSQKGRAKAFLAACESTRGQVSSWLNVQPCAITGYKITKLSSTGDQPAGP